MYTRNTCKKMVSDSGAVGTKTMEIPQPKHSVRNPLPHSCVTHGTKMAGSTNPQTYMCSSTRSFRSSLDEVLAVEAQMLFKPEVTSIART